MQIVSAVCTTDGPPGSLSTIPAFSLSFLAMVVALLVVLHPLRLLYLSFATLFGGCVAPSYLPNLFPGCRNSAVLVSVVFVWVVELFLSHTSLLSIVRDTYLFAVPSVVGRHHLPISKMLLLP